MISKENQSRAVWAILAGLSTWVAFITQRSFTAEKERAVAEAKLAVLQNERGNLTTAIQSNTKEIISMRIEIERLLVVRPADVYRKLEELEDRIASNENGK